MPGSCVAQPKVAVKDMEKMSRMCRQERAAGLHALLQNRIVVVREGAECRRSEEQKNNGASGKRERPRHTHPDYLPVIVAAETRLHCFDPRVKSCLEDRGVKAGAAMPTTLELERMQPYCNGIERTGNCAKKGGKS